MRQLIALLIVCTFFVTSFSKDALASTDFSYIVASDPQWAWTANTDNNIRETEAQKEAGATLLNRNHVKSMNVLANQENVKAVIMNGDLTAYGHGKELEHYESIWQKLSIPLYPGLGNHDYANNLKRGNEGCYQNNCGIRMVEYIRDQIGNLHPRNFDYRESKSYEFPLRRRDYIGSLSYSWDEGNVHFVQLHNYPLYDVTFEGYDAGAAEKKVVQIKQSLDWLEDDLARARNEGKAIILNYHDSDEHWADGYNSGTINTLKNRFSNILTKYGVSAVFVGHYHQRIGKSTPPRGFSSMYGSVPVFYSGSASQSKYLLVHFEPSQMIVERISSVDGGASRTVDGTYPLITDTPATPVTPAPKPGAITFFNEGGYVARYTLVFTSNGEHQSYGTGNLALGNKRRFSLPADATNIRIRGEVKTGLVWEPWRDVFSKSIEHPHKAVCYKTYGTTLNAKWNNNCS
jgi:cytolysin (calcineurin-like family phosphatase)